MTVLYLISKIITFPAVVIRALYEHIFLKVFKIPVENTSYFQLNELFGHVEHDLDEKLSANLCLCCIPGLLQVILAVPMMILSLLQLGILGVTLTDPQTGNISAMFVLCIVLRIVGIWLLGNIFPLYEDALNLWEKVSEKKGTAKVFLFPVAAAVRAGAFLERFGITVWILIIETAVLFWLL